MQIGLYHSAATLDVLSRQLDTLAYNLANVSTTGFKRQVVSQETFTHSLSRAGGAPPVPRLRISVDHSQGVLTPTGNPLDLAIEGKGFFKVETARGIRYLRSAPFSPTQDGRIATTAGDRLVMSGSPGELTAPIGIDRSGEVSSGGVTTGARIPIVEFDDPSQLRPEGGGLFAGNAALEKPATGEIRSGMLEQSNATPVEALVGLVALSRAFESSSRAMKSIGETLQRTTTAV